VQVYRTMQTLIYYCDDIVSLAVLSASVGRNANKSNASKSAQQEVVRQEAMLRDRPNVVVATPAGLLTHMRTGVLDLKNSVDTIVIDEADLVLSFGTCLQRKAWPRY
jgi:ATP-dependent RNA helicase DDX56/DBP9